MSGVLFFDCHYRQAIRAAFRRQVKIDNFRELFLLAVATSIDALAVGVTFSMMLDVNIFLSILLIGSITFLFALAGVKIGNLFGDRFEKQAGILGGCILLAIGVKILLEGLGILG